MSDNTAAERQARRRKTMKKDGLVELKAVVAKDIREEIKVRAEQQHLTVGEFITKLIGS